MADRVNCDGPCAQNDPIPGGTDTEAMEGSEDSSQLEPALPAGIDAIELALVGHEQDGDSIIPDGVDSETVETGGNPAELEPSVPVGGHPVGSINEPSCDSIAPAAQSDETLPEPTQPEADGEQAIPVATTTGEESEHLSSAAENDETCTESVDIEMENEIVVPPGNGPPELSADGGGHPIIPATEKEETSKESMDVDPESEQSIPAGNHSHEPAMDAESNLITPAAEKDTISPESVNAEDESGKVPPSVTCSIESAKDEASDSVILAVERDVVSPESEDNEVETKQFTPAAVQPTDSSVSGESEPIIPAIESDTTLSESEDKGAENQQHIPAGAPPTESVLDVEASAIIPTVEESIISPESDVIEKANEMFVPDGNHSVEPVTDGVAVESDSIAPSGINSTDKEEAEAVGSIADNFDADVKSEPVALTRNPVSGDQDMETETIPGGITTDDLTEEQLPKLDEKPSPIDSKDEGSDQILPVGMKLPQVSSDTKINVDTEADTTVSVGTESCSECGTNETDELIVSDGLISEHLKLEVENLSQQVLHCIADKEATEVADPPTRMHPKLSRTSDVKEVKASPGLPQIQVYKRRWFMLFLFSAVSALNGFHWIQYSIIGSVICRYYDVTGDAVNWTSLIFMIVYPILFLPGAWIMQKIGLRYTVIIGSALTSVSVWVKLFASVPDRFYVALIGQTVAAVANVFILGIPPNVAAVWFGPQQVSSACAIGVFGNQLGIAMGFLIPPMAIHANWDKSYITHDLDIFFYYLGGITTAFTLITLLAFQEKPPLPPTLARSAMLESPRSYIPSILRLIKNPNFVNLMVTYGINAGVYYSMSTLLEQVVLKHFPDEALNVGRIGLTLIVAGMVGSVIGGIVLDKTHRFKATTIGVYVASIGAMAAYAFTFNFDKLYIIFITAGLVGFFMTGYLPVGFEFAAELTYPESEMISSGLLNVSAQIIGFLLTLLGEWLFTSYGDITCNAVLTGCLLCGAVLTCFIKSDLRRQRANNMDNALV